MTLMKHLKRFLLFAILPCLLSVAVAMGCSSNRKTTGTSFAVERQVCTMKHVVIDDLAEFDTSITIEVPVNAPKRLTDSITAYINEVLYEYFDDDYKTRIPYENVYSTDLTHIAEHYWDAYKSFYEETDPSTHWLDLLLVAQTDTYVTYEKVRAFRGEGIHEFRSWTTFVKKDGHRLKKVMRNGDMQRFLEENPEMTGGNRGLIPDDDSYRADFCDYGLLKDSLAFQFVTGTGHDDVDLYDLRAVKPYLPKEVQELVSANGLSELEGIVLDSLENIFGMVTTAKGETVYLWSHYDAVMAYTKTPMGYVPIDVFSGDHGYQRFLNTFTGNKDFVFNESDNTLYVPYSKVVEENGEKTKSWCKDRYHIYQFDGEHFIFKGEGAGFWLHPSVREYESLEFFGKTEDYRVKIDRMADGTYRLAAWKNKADLRDAPDILVGGGSEKDKIGSVYSFEDAANRYVVNYHWDLHDFEVYDKGGRLFFSQPIERIYNFYYQNK